MENLATITKGFQIMRDMLAPYIGRELSLEHGSKLWWREGVINTLYDDQKRDLPQTGDFAELTDSLDIARCLLLFDVHWRDVFKKKAIHRPPHLGKRTHELQEQKSAYWW